MHRRPDRRRSGFTLAEMLTALAMLGILTAMTIPSVMSHMTQGEVARTVADLNALRQAVKSYFADTQTWPSSISALVQNPGSPNIVARRWNGPYLDRPINNVSDGIATGFQAKIWPLLGLWCDYSVSGQCRRGYRYAAVFLRREHAVEIDKVIDGSDSRYQGSLRHYDSSPNGYVWAFYRMTAYVE